MFRWNDAIGSTVVPLIDWSDSEGLLELLSEYVRDEITQCRKDANRKKFLARLLSKINAFIGQSDDARTIARHLRLLRKSVPQQFAEDPVSVHIDDCIQELDTKKQ